MSGGMIPWKNFDFQNQKSEFYNNSLAFYLEPYPVEGLFYKPKYRANIFYSLFFTLILLPSLLLAVGIRHQFTVVVFLLSFLGKSLIKQG